MSAPSPPRSHAQQKAMPSMPVLPPPSADESLRAWQESVEHAIDVLADGQSKLQNTMTELVTKFAGYVDQDKQWKDQLAEKPKLFQSWSAWVFGCVGTILAVILFFNSLLYTGLTLWNTFHK